MTDIELVIKIPEEIYKASQIIDVKYEDVIQIPLEVIKNGTPLPKGHGILKDVDKIKTAFPSGEYVRTESVRATIEHEETIIEADKTESEVFYEIRRCF